MAAGDVVANAVVADAGAAAPEVPDDDEAPVANVAAAAADDEASVPDSNQCVAEGPVDDISVDEAAENGSGGGASMVDVIEPKWLRKPCLCLIRFRFALQSKH